MVDARNALEDAKFPAATELCRYLTCACRRGQKRVPPKRTALNEHLWFGETPRSQERECRRTVDDEVPYYSIAKLADVAMRILIVEDELLVRMFAVDALEDAQFQVEQAGSAADALRCFSHLGEDLAAVIIDLGLPDRSGDELAAELRELGADMPILIASGRSEGEIRDRFAHDPRVDQHRCGIRFDEHPDALESVGVKSPGNG